MSNKNLSDTAKQLEFDIDTKLKANVNPRMPINVAITMLNYAMPFMAAIGDGMPEVEFERTSDFLGLIYAGLRCAREAADNTAEKVGIQSFIDIFASINMM